MRKVFTKRKIQSCSVFVVVFLVSAIAKAQFVERWSDVIAGGGSGSNAIHSILIAADSSIVSSGRNQIIKHSRSGKIIWKADVSAGASTGLAMAQDQSGNIYVTAVNFLNVLSGNGDLFIAKYNSDGQQLWSRFQDGPSHLEDVAAGIGIDQLGNIYVSGTTVTGSLDFPTSRIFTVKLNSDGAVQWTQTFKTGFSGIGNSIAVDFFTGDVYVAGRVTLPTDSNGVVHHDDFTTIKYNTNGEQQWADFYNGSLEEDDEARAVTVDADGNVLVTGFSTEKINSDFFAGTAVITTFKYDRTSGDEIWHKRFGRDQDDNQNFFEGRATNISTDGDDNVIVIGTTASARWHTIKYRKSDGKTLWIKNFDNPELAGNETNLGIDIPSAVGFDKDNNVYVTGLSKFIQTAEDIFTIKYRASDGNELGSAKFENGGNESGSDVVIDARGNAYVTGGSESSFITVSYGVCGIRCPGDITVNNDPGKCSAVVNFTATTTGNCGSLVFLEGQDTVKTGSAFSVGQHHIVVLSPITGDSCSFTITVVDNESPVITQCAANVTVDCAANVPVPDVSLIKATDNCGIAAVTHAGDSVSNKTCANRFTLTRTYKATDIHGNSTLCTQTIEVNDTIPPAITNFSLSKETLFPPNHKMQDIVLNYQVLDNCVSNPPVTITVTSNEAVNGTGDGDTDPDWVVIDAHHIQLRAERSATGNGRIYTITITADDGCNPAVSVTKQVVVAHNITGPQSGNPFKIGTVVNFTGVFWDKAGNVHSAKWLLDSTVAASGSVTEPSGSQNGKVSGSYKFNTAGVYKLQMNITDQAGNTSYANTNGDLEQIVVAYDPNGGNVYGGGWFTSPAGGLTGNPSVTGKASYGFTVNYKNISKPKGETQFELKDGAFEFNAVNFDYLSINGATAQFKGTGKITGVQSGIGFIMTVTDGALDGTGIDKIRMKIYNRNTGVVIYDNQPGASDAAMPSSPVGGSSVIAITGSNFTLPSAAKSLDALGDKLAGDLTISAHPNPSDNYFTVTVNSSKPNEKITMQVFDQDGRLVEVRQNIIAGTVVRLGDSYRPGSYFVRVTQGKAEKQIKLIKLSN